MTIIIVYYAEAAQHTKTGLTQETIWIVDRRRTTLVGWHSANEKSPIRPRGVPGWRHGTGGRAQECENN